MTTSPLPLTLTTSERLTQIKAQRAALNAQLNDINSEGADIAELAKEELTLANEKALVAARVKYGPIGEKWAAVMTRLGVVIVKRANDAHFKQYQEDPKFTFESTEAFTRRCIEYPDLAAWDAIYKEIPGVLADVAGEINKLMGIQQAERVKK